MLKKLLYTLRLRSLLIGFLGLAIFAGGVIFGNFFLKDSLSSASIAMPSLSNRDAEKKLYVIFEKREIVAERPSGFHKQKISGFGVTTENKKHLIYSFTDDPLTRAAAQRYLIPTGHVTPNGKIARG